MSTSTRKPEEVADSRRYTPGYYAGAPSTYSAYPSYGSYPSTAAPASVAPAYPSYSGYPSSQYSGYSASGSSASTSRYSASGESSSGRNYDDRDRDSRYSDSRYDKRDDRSGSSSSYNRGSYNKDSGSSYRDSGSSYRDSGSSYRDSGSSYNRDSSYSKDYGSSSSYNKSYDRDSSSYRGGSAYTPDEPTDDYTQATFSVQETNVDQNKEEDVFREVHNTGINFSKYDNIPVSVTGNEVPECFNTFEEAKLHQYIMDNISRSKYTVPTPVQKHSLGIVSAGRDLMACAQTGSGKTAAFLIPSINRLLKDGCYAKPGRGRQAPEALIVAPTRELAMQIHTEAVKFCFRSGLRSVVCYGGSPIHHQIRELESGCNILVGTPGRLIDLVDRGKISFANIKFLILDEADRMLDMGFEKAIRQIVNGRDMSDRRQTLMFSATFPKEIRQLATDFLYDYLFLKVGRVGSTTESITQNIKYMKSFDKQAEVMKEIRGTPGKTLIFAETKRDTDSLARYLFSQGLPATGIHGDRSQREREAALRSFKAGKINLLVATDVAARGLDIDDVTHVINYDLPANIDSYIHRIGRTGRAGNLGRATSFFTDENKGLAKQLVKVLREANQQVPDWLDRCSLETKGGKGGPMRRGGFGGGYGGGGARYNPYGGGGNANRAPPTTYW